MGGEAGLNFQEIFANTGNTLSPEIEALISGLRENPTQSRTNEGLGRNPNLNPPIAVEIMNDAYLYDAAPRSNPDIYEVDVHYLPVRVLILKEGAIILLHKREIAHEELPNELAFIITGNQSGDQVGKLYNTQERIGVHFTVSDQRKYNMLLQLLGWKMEDLRWSNLYLPDFESSMPERF